MAAAAATRPSASSRRISVDEYGVASGSVDRDEPEPDDLEAELGAHLLEQVHRPVATVAEVEVRADHDEARPQPRHQHVPHEALGGLAAARLVEGEHDRGVEVAGGAEQLELLLERGEQA